MTDHPEHLREFVERWKRVGPLLAKIEAEELRQTDVAAVMRSFSGMVLHVLRDHPPEPTSGLIEMQRLFAKLRR